MNRRTAILSALAAVIFKPWRLLASATQPEAQPIHVHGVSRCQYNKISRKFTAIIYPGDEYWVDGKTFSNVTSEPVKVEHIFARRPLSVYLLPGR